MAMICNLTDELQDSTAHGQSGLTLQRVLGCILELVAGFSVMVVSSIVADPVRHRKFDQQSSTSGPHVCSCDIQFVM